MQECLYILCALQNSWFQSKGGHGTEVPFGMGQGRVCKAMPIQMERFKKHGGAVAAILAHGLAQQLPVQCAAVPLPGPKLKE